MAYFLELICFVFYPKKEVCRPLVLRKIVMFFLIKDGDGDEGEERKRG